MHNLLYNDTDLEVAKSLATLSYDSQTIGMMKEHSLHRTIKYLISNDPINHEIQVGRMFADVMIDDHIYEIQTKQFFLLKDKLDSFLKNHKVTIIYPIHYQTWIHYYQDGVFIRTRKSNKKGTIFDFFYELYSIKRYLNNENLSFKLLFFDIDESKDDTKVKSSKTNRFRKYLKIDQVPRKLIDIIDIKSKEDFIPLLKLNEINTPFTSKDISSKFKISVRVSSLALNIYKTLNLVKIIGKKGKSYLYKVV